MYINVLKLIIEIYNYVSILTDKWIYIALILDFL